MWLAVESLPSYAPELNPVAGACSRLKRTALASLAALTAATRSGLRRIQNRPDLVNGFLTHTGLQLRTQ